MAWGGEATARSFFGLTVFQEDNSSQTLSNFIFRFALEEDWTLLGLLLQDMVFAYTNKTQL